MNRTYEEFLALVKTWAFLNPKVPDQMSLAFEDFESVNELCDYFVFNFLKKSPDQQQYLKCTSSSERAEMLANYLEMDLVRLTRKVSRIQKSQHLH